MSATGYFRFETKFETCEILSKLWDLWPANCLECRTTCGFALLELRYLAGPADDVQESMLAVMVRLRELTSNPGAVDYFQDLGAGPGETPRIDWTADLLQPVSTDAIDVAANHQPGESLGYPYVPYRIDLRAFEHSIARRRWWTPSTEEEAAKRRHCGA